MVSFPSKPLNCQRLRFLLILVWLNLTHTQPIGYWQVQWVLMCSKFASFWGQRMVEKYQVVLRWNLEPSINSRSPGNTPWCHRGRVSIIARTRRNSSVAITSCFWVIKYLRLLSLNPFIRQAQSPPALFRSLETNQQQQTMPQNTKELPFLIKLFELRLSHLREKKWTHGISFQSTRGPGNKMRCF